MKDQNLKENYLITSDLIIKSYIDEDGKIIPVTMSDLFSDRKIIKEFFSNLKNKKIYHIAYDFDDVDFENLYNDDLNGDLYLGDEVIYVDDRNVWEKNCLSNIAFEEVRIIESFELNYNNEENNNLPDLIIIKIIFKKSLLEEEDIYSPGGAEFDDVFHASKEDKINGVYSFVEYIKEGEEIKYNFTYENGKIMKIDSKYI